MGIQPQLEAVLTLKPDLIIGSQSTRQTYLEQAKGVQAQTGTSYACRSEARCWSTTPRRLDFGGLGAFADRVLTATDQFPVA